MGDYQNMRDNGMPSGGLEEYWEPFQRDYRQAIARGPEAGWRRRDRVTPDVPEER